MWLFLKGLIVGFSVAAPVGPIALLCIRRSVTEGRSSGLATGLGAATADALCGIVAALFITAVSAFVVEQREWLHLLGGVFMVVFGVVFMRTPPLDTSKVSELDVPADQVKLSKAYFSTVGLTLINPMTALGFTVAFMGAGFATDTGAPLAATLIVSGVFLGSAAWWIFLSTAATFFTSYLQKGGMRVINIASGGAILAYGLWQLAEVGLHWGHR